MTDKDKDRERDLRWQAALDKLARGCWAPEWAMREVLDVFGVSTPSGILAALHKKLHAANLDGAESERRKRQAVTAAHFLLMRMPVD